MIWERLTAPFLISMRAFRMPGKLRIARFSTRIEGTFGSNKSANSIALLLTIMTLFGSTPKIQRRTSIGELRGRSWANSIGRLQITLLQFVFHQNLKKLTQNAVKVGG